MVGKETGTGPALTAPEVLEILAGTRCPCGHAGDQHRPADPEFRVGQLVEIRGECHECECKGEVGLPGGEPIA